jgi:hypothetical protein
MGSADSLLLILSPKVSTELLPLVFLKVILKSQGKKNVRD